MLKDLKYKVENVSRQLETFTKESNGNYRNEKYMKWAKNSLVGFNTAKEGINEMPGGSGKTPTKYRKK